ncbi:hypothetical protein M3175_14255 [Robertmurraya korlensis]|uniref:hypothetical protein n=1 Tax=Robertmurraya korlensis TaxID=519977 RepID=UPI00203DBCA3|nr:hypothetical protein [Robertmurraya korlensis]MCM3601899.1 hypothetical protein [Robertmurraya korlensis]
MSETERLTERGDKAGIFLTQLSHLPPWSSIGEVTVINTVAATIQQNEAISLVNRGGKLGGTTRQTHSSLVRGTGVFFFYKGGHNNGTKYSIP